MGRNTEPAPNPGQEPGHDPAELGELERGILSIIWRKGAVTAEQVREELARPLKDSTVRTVLRRLEEKGYLEHSLENRTFLYRPSESRQRVAGRAVKRIVDWFCEGSVEALLVGMVDSKVLDRSELQRLAERIAAVQKNAGADGPVSTRIPPPDRVNAVHANGIAHRKKEVKS
jgi:BlaI family transcriptional regulator, penicillinase repressor